MAEGVGFPFPSLPLNEGRTYGQPEVVLISLPQVATGLRLRLPGSFRRRGFQPDLLMPQGALLRRGRSDSFTPAKPEEDAVGNQCRIILKSLKESAKKKTVVLVSHRVSTMNVADVVYEMENGRIS